MLVSFEQDSGVNYIALKAPGSIPSNVTLSLPASDASLAGYVLGSDANGQLGWYSRTADWESGTDYITGDVVTATYDGELRLFRAAAGFTASGVNFPGDQTIPTHWVEVSPLIGSSGTITTLTTSTVQKGGANEVKIENLHVKDSTVTLHAEPGLAVGQFKFNDLDNSNFVSLKAEDTLSSDTTYTLPGAYPSVNGHVLGSNTSGSLDWYPRLPKWAESTAYSTDDVVIATYIGELRFFIALQSFTSGTGSFPGGQNVFIPPGTPTASDYWQELSPFRGVMEGTLSFQSTITPATISTSQTDYDPVDSVTGEGLANANFVRISSTTNVNINGLKIPDNTKNQALFICNVGNSNITIKNESGAGDPQNQFLVGGDRTLQGDEGIMLIYDIIDLRWRSQAIQI